MEEQKIMENLPPVETLPEGDKLEAIFKKQSEFAKRFFDPEFLTEQQREFWSMQMFQAMIAESNEVIGFHNWKHWAKSRKKVNTVEIQYELVDLLHFLVEWMLIWGLTPERVFQLYFNKMQENINRQKGDYHG